MSRFNFGSLEVEPGSMADMYRVLSDAQSDVWALSYFVPAMLQTRAHAGVLLGTTNAPDLAAARADMRIHREQTLIEASVPSTCYLGAAALRHLHFTDRDTMLEQIAKVRMAVEADIEAGPASRLKVGIVPVSYIKPLPDNFPKGIDRLMPQDIRMVETKDDVFIMGNDNLEVDRIGGPGLRGAEALRRQAILGRWADMAVFGEEALSLIDESQAIMLAKT